MVFLYCNKIVVLYVVENIKKQVYVGYVFFFPPYIAVGMLRPLRDEDKEGVCAGGERGQEDCRA